MDKEKSISVAGKYMKRWDCLPDGDAFFTHSSLLWPVMRSGRPLMLKIVDPDDDEAHAGEVLAFFDGRGAVRLIESDGHIQLLERISDHPGCSTLEQMVLEEKDDAATEIICDVIAGLHAPVPGKGPPPHLIPFRKRSDDMRKHVEEGRVRPEDRPIFHIAYDLCDELIRETEQMQIPLHGDIHHFNILRSDQRGWLAIDPKGIMGPRVYEYANSLCNPYGHPAIVANPARMDRQASIMSEQANLDKALLLPFTFLHAMQCAAWSLFEPDQGYWLACAEVAAKLAHIKLA